jgi:2-polyprenyl-6-methoxyphenol hydroxylase-like FAD-dependent oxidoreductase
MIENRKKEVSILIVGAGPTGLLLGCRLLEQGISCRIIEKRTEREKSTRAIGVTGSTLRLFSKMNLLDDFLKEAKVTDRIKFFWNGEATFSLRSKKDNESSMVSKFVYSTQPHMEAILEAKFLSLGGTIEWGTELVDAISIKNAINVFIKKGESTTFQTLDYVVGCDGGQSVIRKKIEAEYDREDYKAFFCVADVELDINSAKDYAEYFLTEEGYCMMIPLPKNKCRVIFSGRGEYEAGFHEKMDEKSFENMVEVRAKRNIRIKNIIWKASGPFRHQVVLTPVQEHLILAGDSLHVFSPIGGTNMNVGLLDADKLATTFHQIVLGNDPDNALEQYAINRKKMMYENMALTKKATYLITMSENRDKSFEQKFIPSRKNYHFLREQLAEQFSLQYDI